METCCSNGRLGANLRSLMLAPICFAILSACGSLESDNYAAGEVTQKASFAAGIGSKDVLSGGFELRASDDPAVAMLEDGPASNGFVLSQIQGGALSTTKSTFSKPQELAPAAIPAIKSSPSLSNQIWFSSKVPTAPTELPLQIGRLFAKGELQNAPIFISNGAPIATQSDVKTRWEDGSVKHAVMAAIVPLSSSKPLGFADAASRTTAFSTPSSERLLSLIGNYDLKIDVTFSGGNRRSVNLREMVTTGAIAKTWMEGTQLTSVVLADHSVKRAYDIGADLNRSIRPIIHLSVWPGTKLVKARVILENANVAALQDLSYAVTVTQTTENGTQIVMQEPSVPHKLGTRWSREFSNQIAIPTNVDHNLAYLTKTGALANYDTSIKIGESTIAAQYAGWKASSRTLYGNGNWVKYMPTTGGRSDIGLVPSWTLLWLYSGDSRLLEQNIGNAELAMAWPMHFRETKPTVSFDRQKGNSGIGLPITVDGRPSVFLNSGNQYINYQYTSAADKLAIIAPSTENQWYPDVAHQPEPYSALYMLTGEYWLLEQLHFWTSWNMFGSAPGGPTVRFDSRGPQETSAGIVDQTRGDAWSFRTRSLAAYLSPDASVEKPYFTRVTNEALSMWEGTRSIPSPRAGSAEYRWGQQVGITRYAQFNATGMPMLNHWDFGSDRGLADEGLDTTKVKAIASIWMQHFVILSLGRGRELGFDTVPLLKWNATLMETMSDEFNGQPWIAGAYHIPFVDTSNRFYPTWAASVAAMGSAAGKLETHFKASIDLEQGYSQLASSASSVLKPYYKNQAVDQFFAQNVRNISDYKLNPKWAILPRE
jgi:hypothetical protein